MGNRKVLMTPDWLTERTTVKQAEQEHLVSLKSLGPEPVLFGYKNAQWLELKAQMQPGDELWNYCSPPESWQRLAGRAGICLVRNGEIIASILTAMN